MFKQVLFIAYYFPPMGGAGVQRSSKYAKYLPGCGWIPLVVSCDDPAFDRDTTLLSDVPRNLQVHRLRWRPHRRHHLHKMLFAIGLGQIATWDRLPDRHSRWYEDALEASRRIIKANRISVIYTTSAPYTSHLIGRTLAGETGIPWVADFRDEWSDNPDSMGSLPRWLAKRHVALEAQVAHEAAHCVFAHPVVAERFAKRHSIDHARVSTITNGYDPIDFAHRSAHAPEPNTRAAAEEIHLVHVGSFYREYNEQPFLAALRLLRKRNSPSLVGLNVHFVGGVTHAKEDFTPACIQVYERRSHAEALQWMASADALLLVFPSSRGSQHIPGKLFEYLASERPIFAVAPVPGTTAEMLRRAGAGAVVDDRDPEAVANALERFLTETRRSRTERDRDNAYISSFRRDRLAKRLADVFDRVAPPATESPSNE